MFTAFALFILAFKVFPSRVSLPTAREVPLNATLQALMVTGARHHQAKARGSKRRKAVRSVRPAPRCK